MARKKKAEEKVAGFALNDIVRVTLQGCSIYGKVGKVVGYLMYPFNRSVIRVLIEDQIFSVNPRFLELTEQEEKAEPERGK